MPLLCFFVLFLCFVFVLFCFVLFCLFASFLFCFVFVFVFFFTHPEIGYYNRSSFWQKRLCDFRVWTNVTSTSSQFQQLLNLAKTLQRSNSYHRHWCILVIHLCLIWSYDGAIYMSFFIYGVIKEWLCY